MSVTVNDRNRLKHADTAHIRAYREMYDSLGEGDFGVAFRHFHQDHPELGRYVVEHAVATYADNAHKWDGIGQFTENYHTRVITYAPAPFTTKWTFVEKQTMWEAWAEMMRSFATGEEADY